MLKIKILFFSLSGLFVLFLFNNCSGGASSTGVLSQENQFAPNPTNSAWKKTDHSADLPALNMSNSYSNSVESISSDNEGLYFTLVNTATTTGFLYQRTLQSNGTSTYTALAKADGSNGLTINNIKKGNAYTQMQGHFGDLDSGITLMTHPYVSKIQLNAPPIVGNSATVMNQQIFSIFSPIPQSNEIMLGTAGTWKYTYQFDASSSTGASTSCSSAIDFTISDQNELWAICYGFQIQKWNGIDFELKFNKSEILGATKDDFRALLVKSPTEIYAVLGGSLYRYNGSTWAVELTPALSSIMDIKSEGDLIVVVGTSGYVATKDANNIWETLQDTDYNLGTYKTIHFPKSTAKDFWLGRHRQLIYFSK